MPRDSAGNYSLVAGNPVISGEVISSNWANTTFSDVSTALTDSLDRNGRGGMLAPFAFADGTALLPAATWVNETTTGLYRFDGGDLRMAVLTQDVMRWQATGAQVWNLVLMQWENLLTNDGTQSAVQVGTEEGQTLYWDNAGTAWKAGSTLYVDDAGGKAGIGVQGATLDTLFTVLDSSTLRAWAAMTGTVQVIERAADVGLSLVGGNINESRVNFGDTDQEDIGNMVYDHANNDLIWTVNGITGLRIDDVGNVTAWNGVALVNVLAVGGTLPVGTVQDAPLIWNDAGSEWVENVNVVMDAATGNITAGTYNGRDVSADGAVLDAHVADAAIHFTEASIDHTAIQNIGTNTHAQLDSHVADATIHWADSVSAVPQARTSGGWVNTTQVINTAAAAQAQPTDLQTLTQAEYDGITPDATTVYFIIG